MIACRACGDVAYQDLVYPQGIFKCSTCGSYYRRDDLPVEWYAQNNYWYTGDEELKLQQRARFVWFEDYILDGPSVEFGAADGDITILLRKKVQPIYPVIYSEIVDKLRPEYAEVGISKSIGQMEDFGGIGKFSNVVMVDTIEHLDNVDLAFAVVSRLCQKGSRFFFSTNDGDAFDGFMPVFYHREHLCILTKSAIFHLAKKYGFSIFRYFKAPQSWLFVILEKL